MMNSSPFLLAKTGDYVLVSQALDFASENNAMSCWVGQIICIIGGGRDPSANSLFQVASIDTGVVKTINAGLIVGIVKGKENKDSQILKI